MLASPAIATRVGVRVEKAVNDGYELTAPVEVALNSQLPFLPKAYFKFQPVFTSPRGEFFSSLSGLNHERYDAVIGSGITLLGGNLEFETGISYYVAGNSAGLAEQAILNNAVNFYYEF